MENTEDENENFEKEMLMPSYACNERFKDGFVYVILVIKGLKTSSEVVFKGIVPKRIQKPSNATVDAVFENKSLLVTIQGQSGDMKWKKFELKVDKLLYEIVADKSYHEVEDNRVLLFLRKKEDRSWYPALKHGLEAP